MQTPYLQARKQETLDSSDNYNHFLPLDRFATEYTPHRKNYCYAVSLQNYTFKNINADIIFELNADYMQQMVDSVDLMKNGCLIIQDSNGDTMLTFSNNEALLKKTDASLLSSLDYSERGYSGTLFQGMPVTVLRTSAQTPNLNYYLIVPTFSLRAPANDCHNFLYNPAFFISETTISSASCKIFICSSVISPNILTASPGPGNGCL